MGDAAGRAAGSWIGRLVDVQVTDNTAVHVGFAYAGWYIGTP